MNLRLGNDAIRPARFAAAALAVAVAAAAAAAIHPAQGAAARHKHDESVNVRLDHHTLQVKGTDANDTIALRLQAGNPGILQVDAGDDGSPDFNVPREEIEKITVDARGGDDAVRIDDSNGAFTNSIPTRIDGGPGDDRIAGGAGAEELIGGPGNDSIDGNGGSDRASLGGGDDAFVWDPGDGSDTIEGDAGTDTMVFNGAGASETVDVSANGNRLRFFRNPGNITMDTHGVERVDFNALGGSDVVTVDDLTGTHVDSVVVDLAGTLDGGAGDGQTDRVVVNGTNGNDAVTITGDAGGVKTSGLAAGVELLHAEPADRLEIDTLAGRDTVDSAGLAPGVLQLLVNGVLVP